MVHGENWSNCKDDLTLHVSHLAEYKVKLECTGVYIIFLFLV